MIKLQIFYSMTKKFINLANWNHQTHFMSNVKENFIH